MTERERALLGRLALGLTREEIARDLAMSPRTVNRIIAALEQKSKPRISSCSASAPCSWA